MPMTIRSLMFAIAMMLVGLHPGMSNAQSYNSCTIAPTSISLGSPGSFTVASQSQASSGAGGLSCTTLLTLAATSYIKVRIDASTFLLTNGAGQSIPFTIATSSGGAALGVGSEVDLSTTALLTLFNGPSSSIPIYVTAAPTSGLAAGTYTGTITLRWYFSVCSVAVATVCVTSSNSPNLTRNAITSVLTSWGTGVPVSVTVTMTVLPDCQITAPDLAFGTAPLVASFAPVIRTISVRCSRNSSYTVGLGNGQNFSGTRRMRLGSTASYLNYEIYRSSSGNAGRWGSAISSERRSSTTADSNPGIHDSSTLQGFTYRAAIDATQPTPAPGAYSDTIIVDIAF